jgi:hypothetical protein
MAAAYYDDVVLPLHFGGETGPIRYSIERAYKTLANTRGSVTRSL